MRVRRCRAQRRASTSPIYRRIARPSRRTSSAGSSRSEACRGGGVRHRHPAVEADREPQSCRRRAESRRASAANKYSIASMHAPSRTEAHRGGTGPAFGSGLTGPHRLPAVSIREIVIAAVSCRVVSCRCRCRCRARSPPVFHPFDSSRRRPRARPASNAAGESPAFDPPDVGSRIPIRAIPYRPLH